MCPWRPRLHPSIESAGICFACISCLFERSETQVVAPCLGMAGDIKFLLWLLLLSCSSPCFGSELDIQCLRDVKQSLIDPNGVLEDTWKFDNGSNGFICQFTGVECWHPDENSVLALRLSNMGLEGQFPRGLQNCNSMTSLDLSNNNFSGPIPRLVPVLASLDLSNNGFSGEIPVSIKNMTYLNTLYLQHNQLSGQIRGQFDSLTRLTSFSVADNKLSGPIPSIFGMKFPASSFVGNQLCGVPLDDCIKRRWRLPRTRINDASSIGAAAGFVVGFVVAFYFPRLFICSRSLRPYFFHL